jgi:16S rRNA (adenine1518-N6/adenine1519-N6)-dimethyltransferase
MAEIAGAVVTIEISPHVFQLASEELAGYGNITLLRQDALANKNHMDEGMLDVVRAKLAENPKYRFKLCANLPYNVATPILSNLLMVEPRPVSLTATIQLELAERIIAQPSTKDYSALSIWMQALADIEIVRTMPPSVFWPRPKVHSAIVHIVPNAEKRQRLRDPEFFHHFIRQVFTLRRKFLRGVLVAIFKDRLDKPTIDQVVAKMGFETNVRAEELPVETLIKLSDEIHAVLPAAAKEELRSTGGPAELPSAE